VSTSSARLARPCWRAKPEVRTLFAVCAPSLLLSARCSPGTYSARASLRGGHTREENVPAQQPETKEDSRLSGPYADQGWPRGAESSPAPRPDPAVGLIWRVRDRATFAALARARRWQRDTLSIRCIALDDTSPPRAAFSIGRSVGNAPVRNRLRRRLRAAVRDHEQQLIDGNAYLITARRETTDMSVRDLETAIGQLLETIRKEWT